jgi:lipopolysaccharide transport system ATP-binding protein
MCDRAVWLDHGVMKLDGPATDVVQAYLNQVNASEEQRHHDAAVAAGTAGTTSPAGLLTLGSIEQLDGEGRTVTTLRSGDPARLRIHYYARETVTDALFGVGIRHETGLQLARTVMRPGEQKVFEGEGHVDLEIDRLPLGPGEYHVDVDVHDSHRMVRFDHCDDAAVLHVQPGDELLEGLVDLHGRWSGPAV